MFNRRSLTIFASTLALVLLAGTAFAQVETWAPRAPDGGAGAGEVPETTTTVSTVTTEAGHEEEVDETTTTTITPTDAPNDFEHQDRVEETTTTTGPAHDEEEHDEVTDTDPPDIVILWPENGQHVDDKTIAFVGKVEPGATVAAGPYVADVDEEGNWRIVLVLSPGVNNAGFTATDAAGNESTATLRVHYDPPETKEEDGSHKEFTAHQKWGENDQAEDIFWGTGIAGDTVWIVSEYGTTTTHVDKTGNWEVKATWEAIPDNTEIRIVIEASNGRQEFSFYKVGPVEKEHEFSANQQYGSCGEDEPYDVFWGTAEPGATIWVESPYGSGSTTANGDGGWEIKVFFNEAPFDQIFEIVVEADSGGRKVFTFIRLGSGEDH